MSSLQYTIVCMASRSEASLIRAKLSNSCGLRLSGFGNGHCEKPAAIRLLSIAST